MMIEGVLVKAGASTLVPDHKWEKFIQLGGARGIIDAMLTVVSDEGQARKKGKSVKDETEPTPEPEKSSDEDAILDAIGEMLASDPEKENQDFWTTAGLPDVREINSRTGSKLKAKERDAIWQRYLDERSEASGE